MGLAVYGSEPGWYVSKEGSCGCYSSPPVRRRRQQHLPKISQRGRKRGSDFMAGVLGLCCMNKNISGDKNTCFAHDDVKNTRRRTTGGIIWNEVLLVRIYKSTRQQPAATTPAGDSSSSSSRCWCCTAVRQQRAVPVLYPHRNLIGLEPLCLVRMGYGTLLLLVMAVPIDCCVKYTPYNTRHHQRSIDGAEANIIFAQRDIPLLLL